MNFKVIQLNTWMGQYHQSILDFIHQEDPDVILMQEVTKNGQTHLDHGVADLYEKISTNTKLHGEFMPMWQMHVPGKYDLGLAIYSKFPIFDIYKEYYFHDLIDRTEEFKIGKPGAVEFPGALLTLKVKVASYVLTLMTTHFIWSMHPEITNDQKIAVNNLINLIKSKDNFILGGDFNVTDNSVVYQELSKILCDDRPGEISSTLHPEIHKVGKEKQLAVDYVFHKGDFIKKLSSQAPVVPISDHLPLVVNYELG